MADRSYTDDEIRALVLDADKGFGSATLHTYRRLIRERDEARRLAKVLAGYVSHPELGPSLDPDEWTALQAALAYPEVKT
jgi:hypothetical protein